MQATYALHRQFTYADAGTRGLRPWLMFMLANACGAGINYGVFMATLGVLHGGPQPLLERQFALVVGTAVSLAFNYRVNTRMVFKGRGLDG